MTKQEPQMTYRKCAVFCNAKLDGKCTTPNPCSFKEPQPEPTCPECGHPEHKSRCGIRITSLPYSCPCMRTPADLQPEQAPSEPIPLIEQIDKALSQYAWIRACCQDMLREELMTLINAWLPAHDQQVASAAVKEFAEKVIIRYANTLTRAMVRNIRALAEKEGR